MSNYYKYESKNSDNITIEGDHDSKYGRSLLTHSKNGPSQFFTARITDHSRNRDFNLKHLNKDKILNSARFSENN